MNLSGCRTCRICRGPVLPGYAHCYQCDQASRVAGGLLADAVAPIAYAVKGESLARDLWRYKSGTAGADEAADRIREMLSAFLGEHGPAVWRAARMADGPRALAVVPSGQGRPGDHPLLAIAEAAAALLANPMPANPQPANPQPANPQPANPTPANPTPANPQRANPPPANRMPVIPLSVRPGVAAHGRYVSTGWLRVGRRVSGLDMLLIEDSWVSGASAQSAAAALKLAGAARVATIVIGRHIDPADPRSAELVHALAS